MEPDVIRMFSSSPPPMEDGAEDEEDEFGDFDGFSSVPNSLSFSEFDTPTTFNQAQALTATSPPELINNGRVVQGLPSLTSTNGTAHPPDEVAKANGTVHGGCQGSGFSARTVNREIKKTLSNSLDHPGSGLAGSQPTSGMDGDAEVLTNGYVAMEVEGSPSSPNSVHCGKKGTSTEDNGALPTCNPDDDFADFAAFSNTEGHFGQTANTNKDSVNPQGGCWLEEGVCQGHRYIEQGITLEENIRDINRTGPASAHSDSIPVSAGSPDRGSHSVVDSNQRDTAFAQEHSASEAVCTKEPPALNCVGVDGSEDVGAVSGEHSLSLEMTADGNRGQSEGKGSGNETETETETSFGRPLSTDALEEYGDMSTTGSVPSPPLQEETATPADHSQLAEDEDFGDFGDAGSYGGQGFADFEQIEVQQEENVSTSAREKMDTVEDKGADDDDDDFGDFDTPNFPPSRPEGKDGGEFSDFPGSESYGNFSCAFVGVDSEADTGWRAFNEPEQGKGEGDSWAAFSDEPSSVAPQVIQENGSQDIRAVAAPPPFSDQTCRTDAHSASLSSRLEKLFQNSFPETPVPQMEEEVMPLKSVLETPKEIPQPGQKEERMPTSNGTMHRDVWRQLQDIHEAFGLRHQWGGSHSNKTLLCSLGIDIRNILFTGQKKQPLIVPMYAAGLGMLEPTKEPVKPISAAEMIASIAQAPPVDPEKSTCVPDTAQEVLPPVQFDWSSSGLTNPLDASGGSSLLNLDFFGPVEDSGSTSSTSIPGVDPELYELTTAKLDTSSSTSRVADAFARLMSTMEKTSTSTRKPRREENLSEEAAKVIAALPDLSFMQAKVLMFPTTLTPLGYSQSTPD
ncbi:aftiphilin a isoform X2 [Lampris incognitus]|uniref:aftiphilin a isoform X2 n=1 Tax=Lampris incognitus TaxID=2546036 RepID=UPI0024B6188B|nr:aftiphilin a isoform X2 [Lampris incognitus]